MDKKYYKLIIYVVSIIIILLIIPAVVKYLLPFIIGIVIAIFVEKPVKFLENHLKISRGFASFIVLCVFFGLTGVVIVFAAYRLILEIGKLVKLLPQYYSGFEIFVYHYIYDLEVLFFKLPPEIRESLQSNINQIYEAIKSLLLIIKNYIVSTISLLPSLILNLVIIFITSYFFSKDKETLVSYFFDIIPSPLTEKLNTMEIEVMKTLINLIKTQMLLVTISTLLTILGFYMLRVEYALILGLLCGFLDIFPIIGPSLIFIPWILYDLIAGNAGFGLMLLLLYIFLIGSRQMLQAKYFGESIGMHPIPTLISIYVGLKIFGISGLIIGPLIIVVLRGAIKAGFISFDDNYK